MLPLSTQVCGSKTAEAVWIFQGEKILSMPQRESKAVGPMSQICGM
jgi:hypothetical protein